MYVAFGWIKKIFLTESQPVELSQLGHFFPQQGMEFV